MSKLVLFLPDGTTLDIPLDRERMTIGRRADNEICLPNLAVSGEHAVVVTILADSFLEDLGSTNGTLVNGKAIAKHFLRDRDEIDVGKHKLVYCTDDDAILEPAVAKGMARARERDSGGRVEMAKSVARAQKEMTPEPEDAERRPLEPASASERRQAEPEPAPPESIVLQTGKPVASIKVLTGVNAGVSMPLTKLETTIGRPGVQVAAIVKNGDAFVLKRIEGERAPVVNNQPVVEDGAELAHGDVIELAGRKIEFVSAGARPTALDSAVPPLTDGTND
jgi:pSer/pThr/pTyr-binding forkhead associated (FHA) protein